MLRAPFRGNVRRGGGDAALAASVIDDRCSDENSQFAEVAARPPPRQPPGAPPRPALRHQQDAAPLQGPPGLSPMLALRIPSGARPGEPSRIPVCPKGEAAIARTRRASCARCIAALLAGSFAFVGLPATPSIAAGDSDTMVAVPKAARSRWPLRQAEERAGRRRRRLHQPHHRAALGSIRQRHRRSPDAARQCGARGGDRPLAIEILDRLVYSRPQLGGGLEPPRHHLLPGRGLLSRSAADIEQVLRIEPRHFGALMGLARHPRAHRR